MLCSKIPGLPDEVEWGLADALGHESVLSHPLNRMVKRKDAKATGAVIAPCVVQRSIKKDPATNAPITGKTRICADGARLRERVSYQTNREGLLPSDEDYDPELDAEFYGRDSDEPYEDQ